MVVKNATETQQEKRTQKNADYKNRTLINADKDKPQMSTDKRKFNLKNTRFALPQASPCEASASARRVCVLSVAGFHLRKSATLINRNPVNPVKVVGGFYETI